MPLRLDCQQKLGIGGRSKVDLYMKHELAALVEAYGPVVLEPYQYYLNGRPRPVHPAPSDPGVEDVAVELPVAVNLLQNEDLSVAFAAFGNLALGYD